MPCEAQSFFVPEKPRPLRAAVRLSTVRCDNATLGEDVIRLSLAPLKLEHGPDHLTLTLPFAASFFWNVRHVKETWRKRVGVEFLELERDHSTEALPKPHVRHSPSQFRLNEALKHIGPDCEFGSLGLPSVLHLLILTRSRHLRAMRNVILNIHSRQNRGALREQ